MKMKSGSLIAVFCLLGFSIQANAIQSYREWKNSKVQEAQVRISSLKYKIDQKKSGKRDLALGKDPNLALSKVTSEVNAGLDPKIEKQLQQEVYNLDLAKDLSVSDYFAGYLIKVQDKKTAFSEVAGKLSPDEVAELMTAYANSVFGTHSQESSLNPADFSRNASK